jgi:hypothetical protein
MPENSLDSDFLTFQLAQTIKKEVDIDLVRQPLEYIIGMLISNSD